MLGYALPHFLYGFANKGINQTKLRALVGAGGFLSLCKLILRARNSADYPKR